MLLLESGWWDLLSAAEQSDLCELPSWHGELFRFLDRLLVEHGGVPWAVLRERIDGEPWADRAAALVDAEDPSIEPIADDLPRSLRQLRAAGEQRSAMQVLGRL